MWKKIWVVIGAIATIVAIIAFFNSYHQNYASAEEVENLSRRLEVKILEDRYASIQQRIWNLEDRIIKNPETSNALKQEIRCLVTEKESINRKIASISEK